MPTYHVRGFVMAGQMFGTLGILPRRTVPTWIVENRELTPIELLRNQVGEAWAIKNPTLEYLSWRVREYDYGNKKRYSRSQDVAGA